MASRIGTALAVVAGRNIEGGKKVTRRIGTALAVVAVLVVVGIVVSTGQSDDVESTVSAASEDTIARVAAGEEYGLMVAEAYGERFIGSGPTQSSVRPSTSVGASEGYGLMVAEAYSERFIGSGPTHSNVGPSTSVGASEEYGLMVAEA